MPDQEFLFALDMSGEPPFDRMLADLTRSVLGYIGYRVFTRGERSAGSGMVGDMAAFDI